MLWGVFLVLGAVTALTARENVWLIVLAGVVVWIVRAPPAWLRRSGTAAEAGSVVLLLQLLGFFTYAGSFVFGSGLAIVPFLHGGVVVERQWLTERQFLDAVAVALITPGPVVITTGFIGYLVAGLPGACVAAGATFLPCFLLTVIPAPYFRKHGKKPAIVAFVDGCTAAAIGTIAGAVVVLGKRSIVDVPTALLMAVTIVLLIHRRAAYWTQSNDYEFSRYSMEEFRRLGGHHSVEIVQWIAMRAALPDQARAEFVYYYPKQVMGYAVAAFRPGSP